MWVLRPTVERGICVAGQPAAAQKDRQGQAGWGERPDTGLGAWMPTAGCVCLLLRSATPPPMRLWLLLLLQVHTPRIPGSCQRRGDAQRRRLLTVERLAAEAAAAALLVRRYVAAVDVGRPTRVVAAACQEVWLVQVAVLGAAPHAAKGPHQQAPACRPPHLRKQIVHNHNTCSQMLVTGGKLLPLPHEAVSVAGRCSKLPEPAAAIWIRTPPSCCCKPRLHLPLLK